MVSPAWGVFTLWMVAAAIHLIDRACDDIWGTNWWRSMAIIVVGYLAFSTIALHGVAW